MSTNNAIILLDRIVCALRTKAYVVENAPTVYSSVEALLPESARTAMSQEVLCDILDAELDKAVQDYLEQCPDGFDPHTALVCYVANDEDRRAAVLQAEAVAAQARRARRARYTC